MPIHPTAIIEADVEIGPDCEVGAYAVIKRFTRLGARNRLYEHAVLGGEPQDVKFKGEQSFLEIGDDNIIREFCTFHRANGAGLVGKRITYADLSTAQVIAVDLVSRAHFDALWRLGSLRSRLVRRVGRHGARRTPRPGAGKRRR